MAGSVGNLSEFDRPRRVLEGLRRIVPGAADDDPVVDLIVLGNYACDGPVLAPPKRQLVFHVPIPGNGRRVLRVIANGIAARTTGSAIVSAWLRGGVVD